jgi:hypothetical protein
MKTAIRLMSCLAFSLFILPPCALQAQAPPAKQKGDDDLRKLLKARFDEASAELNESILESRNVRFSMESLFSAEQRLLQSALELYDQPKDRVAFLSEHIKTLKAIETQMQERFKGGSGRRVDVHRARYFVLDAEIQLLRARREADKAKEKRPE